MKKILIVNNNLEMGGIQKSLINLLKEIHNNYDITLLLFSKSGALLKDVPEGVKIITPSRCYRMLGLTKGEMLRYPLLFCIKFLLMKYASLFSRRNAMNILGLFQRKINGYDVVISYSHLFGYKYFANGCADFVLDKTLATLKICLVHCDYINSGTLSEQNNRRYSEFDKIACCSDSVRKRFLEGSHISSDKVVTLRNFYDLDIVKLANIKPYIYDRNCINILTVARLSSEKGIDKAIDSLHMSGRTDIKYYILGDGPQKLVLEKKIVNYHMENCVLLLGEQENPYRYMLNADYLLVPSLHEAAPMVFDEANILGLPIISTNTTSASEMVASSGILVESFNELKIILENLEKAQLEKQVIRTNIMQIEQLSYLVNK